MVGCRYSYIRGGGRDQSFLRAAVLVMVAVSLGGCAAAGRASVGGYGTTGLIPVNAVATDMVDPSDWEVVRRAVNDVPADAVADRIEWDNPATGSTGNVVILGLPIDRNGTLCRPLATTVSDIRGIRRYSGDACLINGSWRLRGIKADDAQLL
jgi:hypothetical protein